MSAEMTPDDHDCLAETVTRNAAGLTEAIMEISEAYRALGHGTGQQVARLVRFRDRHLTSGKAIAHTARELADWAAGIADMATEYDVQLHRMKSLEPSRHNGLTARGATRSADAGWR
ncbi:hypothetical protein [Streptomyces sp. NPDC047108]|uniref:hypothetical protein n=1 Tax=Streptomyces sp. NPDC047108 TaxID=3155025 RepID=UPI0033DAD148